MPKGFFRLFSFLLLVFIYTDNCAAQKVLAIKKEYNRDQVIAASDVAGSLVADRVRTVRLLSSPEGSGDKIEAASSDPDDLYYFEKEHNVVWIQFKAIKTSGLAISIIPDSESDDYDFLLFKSDGRSTLSKLQNREIKPIRSNIARTKNINHGHTGLRLNEKNTHNSSGENAGFSQTIEVEEGEIFYLVIDNVYANGKGATIDFMYFKEQELRGMVLDSESKPLLAEVIWEDSETGVELAKTTTNPTNGSFSMTVPYEEERTSRYTMTVFSDECMFQEVSYAPVEIETSEMLKLKVVLPKLKTGAISQLSSINFVPGQPVFVSSAYPSLKRLVRLMKKNKGLKILIVGHTNGCPESVELNQLLSEARATVTREYLIEKGISGNRITTEGRNCTEMLFPNTTSTRLQKMNRRIEVNVTAY